MNAKTEVKRAPTPGLMEVRFSKSPTSVVYDKLIVGTPRDANGGSQVVSEMRGPFLDKAQARANAALIAEAFNVHHETGLTPRQLLAQRDELLAALVRVDGELYHAEGCAWLKGNLAASKSDGGMMDCDCVLSEVRALVTKIKGAA